MCLFCFKVLEQIEKTFDPIPSSDKFGPNAELIRITKGEIVAQIKEEHPNIDATSVSGHALDEMKVTIRERVNSNPARLTMFEKRILLQAVLDSILSFGRLGPLLRDPGNSHIYCNGPDETFVERQGTLQRTPRTFDDEAEFQRVVQKFLQLAHNCETNQPRVDIPVLDGRSRVIVVAPPVVVQCTLAVIPSGRYLRTSNEELTETRRRLLSKYSIACSTTLDIAKLLRCEARRRLITRSPRSGKI